MLELAEKFSLSEPVNHLIDRGGSNVVEVFINEHNDRNENSWPVCLHRVGFQTSSFEVQEIADGQPSQINQLRETRAEFGVRLQGLARRGH